MKAWPAVRVHAAEVFLVRLQMIEPFRASHGEINGREVVLLRLDTDVGVGWGECSALPDPSYSGEWARGAALLLREVIAPALVDVGAITPAQVGSVAPTRGNPMARAAVEMALADAALQATGESLSEAIGGRSSHVDVGVVVGLRSDPDRVVESVTDRLNEGYTRVKLKIEPGNDIAPIAAVRERFGSALPLSADANGSYEVSDVPQLRRLEVFDLAYIEQPFASDRLLEHADLAQKTSTPIALDESITTVGMAETAIRLKACSTVVMKPARLGGLDAALKLHDLALDNGVGLVHGGMFESGIGRAAGLAVASLPGFTHPAELSASSRYFRADITDPFVLDANGRIEVPTGPGLGRRPHLEAIESLTLDRWKIPR